MPSKTFPQVILVDSMLVVQSGIAIINYSFLMDYQDQDDAIVYLLPFSISVVVLLSVFHTDLCWSF